MQYIVNGYDGSDEGALKRRMNAREAHLAGTEKMVKEGKTLYAAAILDDNEKMIGSMIIVDFPSRKDLDKWLEVEPYVVQNVWKSVEVIPCRVAPMFAK